MNWSAENRHRLIAAVRKHGKHWVKIADNFPGVSADAARKKFKALEQAGEVADLDHPRPEFVDLCQIDIGIEEDLKLLETIQQYRKRAHPDIISAEVRIRTGGKPICFVPTSCWHLGGIYCFYPAIREKILELLDVERLYFLILGDEWEGFPPGWAQTVFHNLVPPADQRVIVAKIVDLMHRSGKLLCSCWSNHPAFMERLTGEDQAEMLYANKVPYFKGRGILKLYVDDQLYVMSLGHNLPGSSIHNPTHAQGREFKSFNWADFVISGHRHSYAYQEYHVNSRAASAGLTETTTAHLVQVGTAKTGPDPYTLRRWEQPIWEWDTWPCFALSSQKHAAHQIHDLATTRWYLQREDF